VIVGDERTRQPLLAEAARHYRPFTVQIPVTPGEGQEAVARILPFVAAMAPADGQATAFVCREFACREPVTTAAALSAQLTSA